MSMSNTNVVSIVEQAVQKVLLLQIGPGSPSIYISDADEVKDPMPYIVLHGDEAKELIGPGVGIFEVTLSIMYRSHAKPESPQTRQAVVDAINYFAYGTPLDILNATENFHAYGFIPEATGQMNTNPDLKAYEYLTTWKIICMPSNNE